MSDNRALDPPGTTTDRQAPGATLGPGDRVGPFVITATIAAQDAERTYTAGDAEERAPTAPDGAQRNYHVRERASGAFDYARPVAALGLSHAHLLAPVAVVTQSGRDFLITQAVAADAFHANDRLSTAEALAAGVALADALAYLHGGGVAHLRISPALIAMDNDGPHLSGLEDAQLIHPLDLNASALFARDAAFLAHTLGTLAGVTPDDASSRDPLRAELAAMVARAAAGEYTTAAQVASTCMKALERTTADPVARGSAAAAPATQVAPSRPTQIMQVAASATSVGVVRTENQDASAVVQFDLLDDASQGTMANPGGLYLVADGMGGEERGELASRIATRVVVAEVWRGLALPLLHAPVEVAEAGEARAGIEMPSLLEILAQAGRAANARIRTLGGRLGKITGTTLTALLAVADRAALVHVGDSRAYLLRDGTLKQLTSDHTLVARMKAAEHPLLEDPMFAMPRNVLFRSLGQTDEVELDVSELTLMAGDRLLFCSDGLWDELDDERLATMLGAATEPRAAARALVAAADAAGGRDNSTAVVVFIERGA
jgi:protein phosphatase